MKKATFYLWLFLVIGSFYACQPTHKFTYEARQERLAQKRAMQQGNTVSDYGTDDPNSDGTIVVSNRPKGTGTTASVDRMIAKAKTYIGTPHQLGGNGYNGIDCSALMVAAFQEGGITLPRTTGGQALMGSPIRIEKLQKGDLVFFTAPHDKKKLTHVGMVSNVDSPSEITFIHASTSKGVREDNLYNPYWINVFLKARRVDISN